MAWLATESGWARNKHSAICSGKLRRRHCCRVVLPLWLRLIQSFTNSVTNVEKMFHETSLLAVKTLLDKSKLNCSTISFYVIRFMRIKLKLNLTTETFGICAGGVGSGVSHLRHNYVMDGHGRETLQSRDPWREPTANHYMRRWVRQNGMFSDSFV